MNPRIDCFLPFNSWEEALPTIEQLRGCKLIGTIFLLCPDRPDNSTSIPKGCQILHSFNPIGHFGNLKLVSQCMKGDYALIVTNPSPMELGYRAIERMLHVANETRAGIVYADHYIKDGIERTPHPLIDYQKGSLRNDFDMGTLLMVHRDVVYTASKLPEHIDSKNEMRYAGLYALTLNCDITGMPEIVHINEPLYTIDRTDRRTSGEKQFDYVNPSQLEVQREMEMVLTQYLKEINAYIPEQELFSPDLTEGTFPVEASVIIPVRNRVRTIADAVQSALSQQTNFTYNVIIVDNHSTDGTTEVLAQLAQEDKRVIHLIPNRHDLGIGGCWSLAIHHEQCDSTRSRIDVRGWCR